MSMQVRGAGNKKITFVTEDKITGALDEIKLKFDLYKNKFRCDLNNNIINKSDTSFYLNQLCEAFNGDNIEKIVSELNYINSCTNLYEYIRFLLNKYEYIPILKNTIKEVKKEKILTIHDDLYLDLHDIKKLNNGQISDEIDKNLNIINNEITRLKNIKLKVQPAIEYNKNAAYSPAFITNLEKNMNHILSVNELVKNNLNLLYKTINCITNLITVTFL